MGRINESINTVSDGTIVELSLDDEIKKMAVRDGIQDSSRLDDQLAISRRPIMPLLCSSTMPGSMLDTPRPCGRYQSRWCGYMAPVCCGARLSVTR